MNRGLVGGGRWPFAIGRLDSLAMNAPRSKRRRLALTVGDMAGIGPETTRLVLGEERLRAAADVVVFGPASACPKGVTPHEGAWEDCPGGWLQWVATGEPGEYQMGQASAGCGRAALRALEAAHGAALAGWVDALVTGPVSKTALHLAGESVEGQTELFQRWCGVDRILMVALAGPLRVGLVTRHLSLRAALDALSGPLVLEHLELLADFLEGRGHREPRLGLAGLNPHAGEGGRFGNEELEFLNDAAEEARGRGLDVRGPLSPDSVFRDALEGRLDGVLALYHDQAFIPLKLVGGQRAVTALAGLPYLRLSPVHGTAFDIAGRGLASHANLLETLLLAAAWARTGAASPGLTAELGK